MKINYLLSNKSKNIEIESNKLLKKIKEKKEIFKLSLDEELYEYIQKIKTQFYKSTETKSLLIDWFAVGQEISYRTLGQRHFDTQLLAGIFLNEGLAVEMKTGEGKTLASTLAASWKALSKKGVHLITVNEYLAERDEKTLGKFYKKLGLSSGLIKNSSNPIEKKKNYECDITYVTNSEVVFDFLKDCSSLKTNNIIQRPLYYCIIDEIDSILIDEARTPLIISTGQELKNANVYIDANKLVKNLKKNIHFIIDEKQKDLSLTEKGYELINQLYFRKSNFDLENSNIIYVLNSLKANYLYSLNKDYIILNEKICIIDEFTGRIMPDRRWSGGIHEAIEAKENLAIENQNKTKISITYQNFFRFYKVLSGMTGTAKTVEMELKKIYDLDVIVVPTTKPIIRKDLADKIYINKLGKWKAILQEALLTHSKGQPLLIGTASVENSEFLSELFSSYKVQHRILNAKPENLKQENEIIAQAGENYAVTIATNMAGRGTDIILGGNLSFKIRQFISNNLCAILSKSQTIVKGQKNVFYLENLKKFDRLSKLYFILILKEYKDDLNALISDIENLPYSLDKCKNSLKNYYALLLENFYPYWKEENTKVKKLGGLKVLGSERHESRRIDDQLRGRSGRQGDPGISQFYVSFEDELLIRFGGNNLKNILNFLGDNNGEALESKILVDTIKKAQERIESFNYEIRKNILDYDSYSNYQFKIFFELRKNILLKKNIFQFLILNSEMVNSKIRKPDFDVIKCLYQDNLSFNFDKKLNKTNKAFEIYKSGFIDCYNLLILKMCGFSGLNNHKNYSLKKSNNNFLNLWYCFDERISALSYYQSDSNSENYLMIFDNIWINHIDEINFIRETNNWKSYGQQNPLYLFNYSLANLFKELIDNFQEKYILIFYESFLLTSNSNKELWERNLEEKEFFSEILFSKKRNTY